MQKILIIGSGGREHAIGWKIAQSAGVGKIFFAPGNAGTVGIGDNLQIAATNIDELLQFAKKEKIDLTLAIPDDPLALGIVDKFKKEGLRIFGPSKAAAKIESSKTFAKDFMKRHNLPTSSFKNFNNISKAREYISNHEYPLVVKVSGLAFGKGVFICQNKKEANKVLENILTKKIFGESGSEVVIENFLNGTEISTHAFSDGKNYSIFPISQDHKRIGENNTGPNTGGMGTIAPIFIGNQDKAILKTIKDIEKNIISKTLTCMAKEGFPFHGVLYPGLMLTKNGPKILEYNARFGDPETQTYMRLLDTDLLKIINACVDQKLSEIEIKWKNIFACTIILASNGYPGLYEKGKIISGLEKAQEDQNVVIFHAGTKKENGKILTNGGRVLGVSATGATLNKALNTAYQAISKISFDGMQYRKDIGNYVCPAPRGRARPRGAGRGRG